MNPDQIAHSLSIAEEELGQHLHQKCQLSGGTHATTLLVGDESAEFVARIFPPGDAAISHEIGILERLSSLGDAVPCLFYARTDISCPIIVTSRVVGSAPPADLPPEMMAVPLAHMLAHIHSLSGKGLRPAPLRVPSGGTPIAVAAESEWDDLDTSERVLTHYDYWSGNTLWHGGGLSGVVDWSGARHAPRGVDVAWCRQDLVLLGSPAAADTFLATYETATGVALANVTQWDRQAAAQADPAVETWAPNYAGIGRSDISPQLLRKRLNEWSAHLLNHA